MEYNYFRKFILYSCNRIFIRQNELEDEKFFRKKKHWRKQYNGTVYTKLQRGLSPLLAVLWGHEVNDLKLDESSGKILFECFQSFI